MAEKSKKKNSFQKTSKMTAVFIVLKAEVYNKW